MTMRVRKTSIFPLSLVKCIETYQIATGCKSRSQVEDSHLSVPSRVQAQQVQTIARQRVDKEVVGSLKEELMTVVDAALKLHLALD